MDPTVGSTLIATAANTVNGFAGLIGQRNRERRNFGYTSRLMDIQFKNQQALNRQGQELQLDTWEKTNYPAQIAMLKKAGMNPSLLYGKGGAGGATTGSQGGGSAAMGYAPPIQQWPMDIGSSLKLAAELRLLKAQERNINADANIKETTGIKEAESRIAKLIAETNTEYGRQRVISLEADLAEIEKANRDYRIKAEIDNVIEQARQLRLSNEITDAAMPELIDEIKFRAAGQALNNTLTEARISLTKEEERQIKESLLLKARELDQQDVRLAQGAEQLLINRFTEEIKAEFPGIGQVAGGIAKQFIRNLQHIANNPGIKDVIPEYKK